MIKNNESKISRQLWKSGKMSWCLRLNLKKNIKTLSTKFRRRNDKKARIDNRKNQKTMDSNHPKLAIGHYPKKEVRTKKFKMPKL